MRQSIRMTVGAAEYPLAPTYGALAEIEQRLDSSLAQIYDVHRQGGLKLIELAAIVTAGMNAAKPDVAEIETVASHLYDAGVGANAVRLPVAKYLLALGWAPEDAAKKRDADWPELSASSTSASETPPKAQRKAPARRRATNKASASS